MVKIIHAADFHLDSPFASLPELKAAERRREQRSQLSEIAEKAEDADIVLLSGDLFDTDRAYGETLTALSEFFMKVKAKIFIAPGNHDYYTAKSPYAHMKLPENVHIFTSNLPCGVAAEELGCVVWGCAFTSERAQPPLRGFRAPENGLINIMVLHGDTSLQNSSYGYISRADINGSGLDYLALGHLHTHSGIQKEGNTFWAYPGCTLGRGFDETGAKGLISGYVGKGGCQLGFVPLNGRRYERISVDITGALNITETVLSQLPEGCGRDVYRLTLTGTCENKPRLTEIHTAINDRFDFVDIIDGTRIGRDIWESASEDTLKGNFLRILRLKYDSAADEEERDEIALAARFGLAALEYREDV